MNRHHHYAIGRTGVIHNAKEQVLLIPNAPINPEPIRHTEPIKMEKMEKQFFEKKKKSKYQRE
jgi:hypothetical protein